MTNESKQSEQAGREAPAGKEAASSTAPADASSASEGAAAVKPVRIKSLRQIPVGIAHINASFNNTQVTITDPKGNVLAWCSSGRVGFKGTRKSTAYAATVVAQETAKMVSQYRMQEVEIRVQGPGAGRESAIRAFQTSGFTITMIKDVTSIPHNGCRPRKRRRV